MKSFLRRAFTLAAASFALSASAAGDPVDKAIEARRAVMTLQSWYAGPLFQMARGAIPYEADAATRYAANLAAIVNADGGAMWPEGSDHRAYPGETRALPEIWSAGSEVGERDQALREAVAALAEVAGDGLDALRSRIGPVGNACSRCHDDYREEH